MNVFVKLSHSSLLKNKDNHINIYVILKYKFFINHK